MGVGAAVRVLTAGFAHVAGTVELLVPPLHPAEPGLHPVGGVQPRAAGGGCRTTQRGPSALSTLNER